VLHVRISHSEASAEVHDIKRGYFEVPTNAMNRMEAPFAAHSPAPSWIEAVSGAGENENE